MKITLSLAALIAVTVGGLGFVLVAVATLMDGVPRRLFVPGMALLLLGSVAWLHDRINVTAEKMREREEIVFQLGKVSGTSLRMVPRQRRVDHTDV